jgi:hypothetical protein
MGLLGPSNVNLCVRVVIVDPHCPLPPVHMRPALLVELVHQMHPLSRAGGECPEPCDQWGQQEVEKTEEGFAKPREFAPATSTSVIESCWEAFRKSGLLLVKLEWHVCTSILAIFTLA